MLAPSPMRRIPSWASHWAAFPSVSSIFGPAIASDINNLGQKFDCDYFKLFVPVEACFVPDYMVSLELFPSSAGKKTYSLVWGMKCSVYTC